MQTEPVFGEKKSVSGRFLKSEFHDLWKVFHTLKKLVFLVQGNNSKICIFLHKLL